MLETAFYLVTKEIAIRSGLIESRHRVKDGRFVLNDRDLSRIRFTNDEFINGLDGVEKITKEEAKNLIRENGFALGEEKLEAPKQSPQEQEEEIVAPKNEETEANKEEVVEMREEEAPSIEDEETTTEEVEENNEQEVEQKEEEE